MLDPTRPKPLLTALGAVALLTFVPLAHAQQSRDAHGGAGDRRQGVQGRRARPLRRRRSLLRAHLRQLELEQPRLQGRPHAPLDQPARSASPRAASARARRPTTRGTRSGRPTTSRCRSRTPSRPAEAYYARGRYDYKLSRPPLLHGRRGLGAQPLLGHREPLGGRHRRRLHPPERRLGRASAPRRASPTPARTTRSRRPDNSFVGARARLGLPPEAVREHDLHAHADRRREPRGHATICASTRSSACTWR